MNSYRRRIAMLVGLWDLGWRIVAVRRAIQNHDRKWLLPLLTVSSAGILPIVYLFRFGAGPDEDTVAEDAPAA